jgi:hypothetical protein
MTMKPHHTFKDGKIVRIGRPFRFEDLEGKPEPESWGPVYPKTASAAVEKWRKLSSHRDLSPSEVRDYGRAVHAWIQGLNAPKKAANTLSERSNCASRQTTTFSAKKHRAALIAAFHADAERDRREWALGRARDCSGRTIREAYAAAMGRPS